MIQKVFTQKKVYLIQDNVKDLRPACHRLTDDELFNRIKEIYLYLTFI